MSIYWRFVAQQARKSEALLWVGPASLLFWTAMRRKLEVPSIKIPRLFPLRQQVRVVFLLRNCAATTYRAQFEKLPRDHTAATSQVSVASPAPRQPSCSKQRPQKPESLLRPPERTSWLEPLPAMPSTYVVFAEPSSTGLGLPTHRHIASARTHKPHRRMYLYYSCIHSAA